MLEDEENPLCQSCRLTRVIPDLGPVANKVAWYKLEVAKHRLVYTLRGLNLPIMTKAEDAERGLAFEFLADPGEAGEARFTAGPDGTCQRPHHGQHRRGGRRGAWRNWR